MIQIDRRTWVLLLGALPLASGAALIIHILWGFSLGLALLIMGATVIGIAIFVWQKLSLEARAIVAQRFRVGLIAGIVAVLAYDGTRFLFVNGFHTTFQPFDVFPTFGNAIAGSSIPEPYVTIVGILYHFTNGLMFAVSYTILFGPRSWWIGILWGLGLETLMLGFYPGWQHPKVISEFTSVSMLGHVAYGAALGGVSQLILRRLQRQ